MATITQATGTHLWAHQQEAFDFLCDKPGGMLAMGMGSGKTAVAIKLIEHWGCSRVLVLCPKSVVQVWPWQLTQHGGDDWRVLPLDEGTILQRVKRMQQACTVRLNSPLCVVLNYDVTVYSAMAQALKAQPWDAVIADEAHKLKAAAGKQSRFASQLSDRVPRRLALTGTPLPHSPLDIYAQARFVDKTAYGNSFVAFRSRYAVMGGYQNHEVRGFQNLTDLHERMYRFTYRCRTEDVLDLPEAQDVDRYCELEPASRKVYEGLKEELIAELGAGTVTADNALVKLLRLAQITGGHVKDDEGTLQAVGSEKAALLREVLEELRAGYGEAQEPIVVFSRFSADVATVRRTAAELGMTTAELSGDRSDLKAWQNGDGDVLSVQIQSGSDGIDLTRTKYAIYYSQDWSLGTYEQSKARINRPGQTRPVTYIHLVARDTVDETIRLALARRKQVVDFVVDELLAGGKA